MSAVEEYHRFQCVIEFGPHILAEDVSVVRDAIIKFKDVMDAAIAELEQSETELQDACDSQFKATVRQRERAEKAEARVTQLEHVLSRTRDQRIAELEAEVARLNAICDRLAAAGHS